VASPGFMDRTLARVRARSLDERLLAGARPEESRLMRARSAEVLDRHNRAEVARALREMLDAAEHARRIFLKAQLRLREFPIVKARSPIRDLCDVLEGSMPVSPRGVILADRLVRDGGSPMFWPSDDSIEAAVEEARAALDLD
jgi:hypothetical protein